MLKEFLGVVTLGQEFDRAAQPAIGVGFAALAVRAFLVGGMGGDAEFSDRIHVVGADLQLDALMLRPDDRGVNRAVIVLLRRRDIVLEAPRHEGPGLMDDAERAVTIINAPHDNAEAEDIRQLLEGDALALHLPPDRIDALLAPLDLAGNLVGHEFRFQVLLDELDQPAGAVAQRLQALGHHQMRIGAENAEADVFQFLAHVLHADSPGERRIDLQRFLGDAGTLVRRYEMQRAHIVEPVRELHQQHAGIRRDGKQQLPEILGLRGFFGDKIELLDLGEAVHEIGDVLAEPRGDILARRAGILDRIVEDGRRDGLVVDVQIGEDRRDFERM